MDAFREDALGSQRLGYLTPQEYGYVLARRAAVFGEDRRIWFTSPQAYEAYEAGRRLAERDAVAAAVGGRPVGGAATVRGGASAGGTGAHGTG